MKKIIIFLLLLFSFNLYAELNVAEINDLVDNWDINVFVMESEYTYGNSLNLIDKSSETWIDVSSKLSTFLFALTDEMNYRKMSPDELEHNLFIYRWDDGGQLWAIYIDQQWLSGYMSARKESERSGALHRLVGYYIQQWEGINKPTLQRQDDYTDIQSMQEELNTLFNN